MNLPPYNTFPEIRSEKILLREVKQTDIPFLLEILTYDGKTAGSLEEGIRINDRINQDYLDGDTVNWVIEELETHEPIGFIGYYRGFENGIGELGFILKSAFRGLGYMAPSLRLAAEFGINQMELDQVIAITKKENIKAIGVLERTDFKLLEELTEEYLKFRFMPKTKHQTVFH